MFCFKIINEPISHTHHNILEQSKGGIPTTTKARFRNIKSDLAKKVMME